MKDISERLREDPPCMCAMDCQCDHSERHEAADEIEALRTKLAQERELKYDAFKRGFEAWLR